MDIDDLIDLRNEIQLHAENISPTVADQCWQVLGIANRHIMRVLEGTFPLSPAVEQEILQCLDRGRAYLKDKTS